MLPRSPRLLSMGYYGVDGRPQISYKERINRVFRKRKKQRQQPEGDNRLDEAGRLLEAGNVLDNEGQSDIIRLTVKFGPFTFIALIMVFIGMVMMHMQLLRQLNFAEAEKKMMLLQLMEQLTLIESNKNMMLTNLREQQKELLHLTKKHCPVADTMPNFASEKLGASVIAHLSSKPYSYPSRFLTWFWTVPLLGQHRNPIIQEHPLPLTPGRCWDFAGSQGHVFISLKHSVKITNVTMGHITSMQSPNGFIYSAPRKFSVYGLTQQDVEPTNLGTFEYNPNGESLQTFKIPSDAQELFTFVKLQIENNWGNSEYTCLYQFRVGRCYSVKL